MSIRSRTAFATLAILSVLDSCDRPIADLATLGAIRAEARGLIAAHLRKGPGIRIVSTGELPPAIASLHPEHVTVRPWGVDIQTRSYFDGGWGYEVPRDRTDLLLPAICYSEPGKGVFWHGPC